MKWLGIFLIRAYQVTVGPLFKGACRFEPSCSNYGLQALDRFGLLKGSWLTLRRLLRCRPGGPHGYDPVPEQWPGFFGRCRLPLVAVAGLFAAAIPSSGEPASPIALCARLEARIAAGDGVLLPSADLELVRFAGTIDLARGGWPEAFIARAGETVCVAVSPFTGCYEFFDESGAVFWTVMPILPTTENWVAPFRHAEGGTHPDDGLYAPWRLVDVWVVSQAESAEFAEFSGRARPPRAPRLESHAESAENAEASDLDELGHACGLDDIYWNDRNNTDLIPAELLQPATTVLSSKDQTGPTSYYSPNLTGSQLIRRLLMNGDDDHGVNSIDIPLGSVKGVDRTNQVQFLATGVSSVCRDPHSYGNDHPPYQAP